MENSWTGLDRVFLLTQSGNKGAARLVLLTRGTPKWKPIRLFHTVSQHSFYTPGASEAQGLGGALQALLQQPFGPWLLGVVALGLVAYGLLMLATAYYRLVAPGRAF